MTITNWWYITAYSRRIHGWIFPQLSSSDMAEPVLSIQGNVGETGSSTPNEMKRGIKLDETVLNRAFSQHPDYQESTSSNRRSPGFMSCSSPSSLYEVDKNRAASLWIGPLPPMCFCSMLRGFRHPNQKQRSLFLISLCM